MYHTEYMVISKGNMGFVFTAYKNKTAKIASEGFVYKKNSGRQLTQKSFGGRDENFRLVWKAFARRTKGVNRKSSWKRTKALKLSFTGNAYFERLEEFLYWNLKMRWFLIS